MSRAAHSASESIPESPPKHTRAHARRDGEAEGEPGRGVNLAPLVDPLWCQMAMPPGSLHNTAVAATPSAAMLPLREDLQNLLIGFARRAAWGGDRRKGSARIELSEGALAGATLLVHTDERAVSVELELPGGAGGMLGLEQRILERLEARGFFPRVRVT